LGAARQLIRWCLFVAHQSSASAPPTAPQDTDAFCRGVLCSPEVVAYIGEQFLAWGGDIRRADAFTVGRGTGAGAGGRELRKRLLDASMQQSGWPQSFARGPHRFTHRFFPPPLCAQLSTRLHVTTYPCVALLAYPGARTKVVACLQGRFTAAQLLAALRRAVVEHGTLLAAERFQREERVRAVAGWPLRGGVFV
jgi:hypothetical protein